MITSSPETDVRCDCIQVSAIRNKNAKWGPPALRPDCQHGILPDDRTRVDREVERGSGVNLTRADTDLHSLFPSSVLWVLILSEQDNDVRVCLGLPLP